MKKLLFMLVAILGVGSVAFAQSTTMPSVDQPVKVLVIPFSQIGTGGHEWVGAAIHENLVTQASADSAVQAVGMNQPLQNSTLQDAISAAKGAGAQLVVFGSFQFAGDQLRVQGRVLETTYGQTIGTLNATGAIIDLFKIEDQLSTQLTAALPQPATNLPTISYGPNQSPDASSVPVQTPYYAANAPDAGAAAAGPTYVYAPQYTTPAYPNYYPAYYPSYYGYGYPYYGGWWGGGVVIINGNRCFGRPFCGPFVGRPGFHGGAAWGNPGFRGGVAFGNGGFRGGAVGFHGGGFSGGGFTGGAHFGGGMGGMGGGHGR